MSKVYSKSVYRCGETYPPEPKANCWEAGINVDEGTMNGDEWHQMIVVYGETKERAESNRDRVLEALRIKEILNRFS